MNVFQEPFAALSGQVKLWFLVFCCYPSLEIQVKTRVLADSFGVKCDSIVLEGHQE